MNHQRPPGGWVRWDMHARARIDRPEAPPGACQVASPTHGSHRRPSLRAPGVSGLRHTRSYRTHGEDRSVINRITGHRRPIRGGPLYRGRPDRAARSPQSPPSGPPSTRRAGSAARRHPEQPTSTRRPARPRAGAIEQLSTRPIRPICPQGSRQFVAKAFSVPFPHVHRRRPCRCTCICKRRRPRLGAISGRYAGSSSRRRLHSNLPTRHTRGAVE